MMSRDDDGGGVDVVVAAAVELCEEGKALCEHRTFH
jgi:hypothetical protein